MTFQQHSACTMKVSMSLSGWWYNIISPFMYFFYYQVCVTRSLIVCAVFCRSLFVLLSFFFRPLCCLFFFDTRFWLPFWYLKILLVEYKCWNQCNPVSIAFTIFPLHLFYLSRQTALTGYIFIVTDRNIALSGTSVTCYLLSFGNLDVNPVHLLLTENIKRGNQGMLI